MSKKFWWIAGGLLGAGVAAAVASMAVLRSNAPDEMAEAAESTPGVKESFVYRESNLLGGGKVAGANLVVDAYDAQEAERIVREVFANVEQAMLSHGFDELSVTARTADGTVVIEATNVDGPLSVLDVPVAGAQVASLVDLPVEMLDEQLDSVLLAR